MYIYPSASIMGHNWEANSKGDGEQNAGLHLVSWQHQDKMAYGSMRGPESEGVKHGVPEGV